MERLLSECTVEPRLGHAEQIYRHYGDFIYRAIRCRVASDIEADDIFQQFFLSLMQHPIPESITNVESYLNRAVNNDVLDQMRKEKRYRARLYRQCACARECRVDDPSELASRAEYAEKMLNLLRTCLPFHESNTIIKRYYKGQDIREISAELGANRRSISRYLCTGLQKIRHLLKQQNDEIR